MHRLAEHTSSARVLGAEGQDGGRRAQGAVRLGAVEAAREAEHLATRIEQLRTVSQSQSVRLHCLDDFEQPNFYSGSSLYIYRVYLLTY